MADPPSGKPQVLLLASGSEVSLSIDAYEKLASEGIGARVVSMTCWEIFEKQSPEYRESVLPAEISARVAVEQASTFGWSRYVGANGVRIGMHTFSASAPLKELQRKFGFTADQVIAAAREQIGRRKDEG